jgi:SAM-dependent methyltransferase
LTPLDTSIADEQKMFDKEEEKAAQFTHRAIRELARFERASDVVVLDFGCGRGDLIQQLLSFGYDAYGCDVSTDWVRNPGVDETRFRKIGLDPYRLPFEDGSFDVVVSTSVLEHAQNKEDCFREIHRILRSGGYSIHVFPSKWYLPVEPHISVPLANYVWPYCPRWWLTLWAILGVRNRFQGEKSWRKVVASNLSYCATQLCYWPKRKYRRLSMDVFGNFSAPMEFYIDHAYGGYARMARRLPFRKLSGWLSGVFRIQLIVQQKTE